MSLFSNLVCILVVTCACSTLADSPTPKLRGVITDSEGAAISGALILVHWDRSGVGVGLATNVGLTQDKSVETNKSGEFVAELPPGFYDVFVSVRGFSPACHKIRVKAGETATYDAALEVNDLVTKELGFTIPK